MGQPQYRDGLVKVDAASATVTKLWEMYLSNATGQFLSGGPVKLAGSGATAIVRRHDLSLGKLSIDLDSGSADPALADVCNAPGTATIESGTATSGAVTTLTDTAKAWAANEHNGRWLRRPNAPAADEWRQVTATSATQLTVSPAWGVAPAASEAYSIYELQSADVLSWVRGTPPDFTVDIQAGDLFSIVGSSVWKQVQTVAAKTVTLDSVWGGPTKSDTEFGFARDFDTMGLNLPLPNDGDTQLPSLMSRAINEIASQLYGDDPILVAGGVGYSNSWEDFLGGWQEGAYMRIGRRVYLEGLIKHTAADITVDPWAIFTLPVGYRPSKAQMFIQMFSGAGIGEEGLRVEVQPSGVVRMVAGSQFTPGVGITSNWISLSGIHFELP